ncbi:MAG: BrnT family toxin [Verrucomicrobiales bacterium]
MEFEFDPEKSVANRAKHGIDFVEAQELWGDPKHLIVPARSTTEARYALIGEYDDKVWVCIFTLRAENLRIISARRARNEEKEGFYHR